MHVTRADNENYNGCGKAAHRSKIGLTHIKPLLANIISTRFKIHHALLRVLLQQHEVLNHHFYCWCSCVAFISDWLTDGFKTILWNLGKFKQ